MRNPDPQKTDVLFYEMGWEGPIPRQRWWILLRWILLGVVGLATFVCTELIHLDIPALKILSLCAVIALINALLHYGHYFVKERGIPRFTSR